ncbi:MAG: hypothetical protein Q8906_04790 [Bacillota bacterium]|nr:hypothetical protein [Bacillota bacterium]
MDRWNIPTFYYLSQAVAWHLILGAESQKWVFERKTWVNGVEKWVNGSETWVNPYNSWVNQKSAIPET